MFYDSENSTKDQLAKHGIGPSKTQTTQPHDPITFTNSSDVSTADFDCIYISDFINNVGNESASDVEVVPSNIPRASATETDYETGRQGEKLVFDYLKWKYHNANVTWINEKGESGKPYDIRMIFKSENNREEYIEVKTTRSNKQNSFFVSIGEIEYLLKHPSNYSIYRVYYANILSLSTITVINNVKGNIQKKRLTLSMNFEQK